MGEVLRDEREQHAKDHERTRCGVSSSVRRDQPEKHRQPEQTNSAHEQDQRVHESIADRVPLPNEQRQRAHHR